ncbi:MAG: DUF3147 family protein [Candidatus Thermoplasmatota archaeon]|nr:DUF3147 family protein [Candidatus Thermoplasmatota archaeon]
MSIKLWKRRQALIRAKDAGAMDSAFLLKILLSFLIGGIWVSVFTVLAEKLGTKIGGVLACLPATIMVSLIFIGITQSAEFAAQSVSIVPAVMGINCLFLLFYTYFLKFGKVAAPLISLAIWAVMAFALVALKLENIYVNTLIFAVLAGIALYVLEFRLSTNSQKKGKMKYTLGEMLFRGTVAGTAVASSVIIAHYGGPILGGLFSAFPAVFSSTMIIFSRKHGSDFAGAMGKSMVAGAIDIVIFVYAVTWALPKFGLALGLVICYAISVAAAVPIYFVVRKLK